jgi:hypothetical protein
MKALPMFDNLMLWIARGFAVFILVYGILDFYLAITLFLPELFETGYRKFLIEVACLQMARGVLYLGCLFWLRSPVSRALLGITAGYGLITNLLRLFSSFSLFHFPLTDWKADRYLGITLLSCAIDLLYIQLALRSPAKRPDLYPQAPDVPNGPQPVLFRSFR